MLTHARSAVLKLGADHAERCKTHRGAILRARSKLRAEPSVTTCSALRLSPSCLSPPCLATWDLSSSWRQQRPRSFPPVGMPTAQHRRGDSLTSARADSPITVECPATLITRTGSPLPGAANQTLDAGEAQYISTRRNTVAPIWATYLTDAATGDLGNGSRLVGTWLQRGR